MLLFSLFCLRLAVAHLCGLPLVREVPKHDEAKQGKRLASSVPAPGRTRSLRAPASGRTRSIAARASLRLPSWCALHAVLRPMSWAISRIVPSNSRGLLGSTSLYEPHKATRVGARTPRTLRHHDVLCTYLVWASGRRSKRRTPTTRKPLTPDGNLARPPLYAATNGVAGPSPNEPPT